MARYTAFILSKETQQRLLTRFPPLYPQVKADHITHKFGTDKFGDLFHPQKIEITGMVDSSDGLQALVVKVDGKQFRPDGNPYHITWSLDPQKYSAVDSNELVRKALDGIAGISMASIIPSIAIEATPALIEKIDGGKTVHPLPLPLPAPRAISPT